MNPFRWFKNALFNEKAKWLFRVSSDLEEMNHYRAIRIKDIEKNIEIVKNLMSSTDNEKEVPVLEKRLKELESTLDWSLKQLKNDKEELGILDNIHSREMKK